MFRLQYICIKCVQNNKQFCLISLDRNHQVHEIFFFIFIFRKVTIPFFSEREIYQSHLKTGMYSVNQFTHTLQYYITAQNRIEVLKKKIYNYNLYSFCNIIDQTYLVIQSYTSIFFHNFNNLKNVEFKTYKKKCLLKKAKNAEMLSL